LRVRQGSRLVSEGGREGWEVVRASGLVSEGWAGVREQGKVDERRKKI
jgi:hypothetical protein